MITDLKPFILSKPIHENIFLKCMKMISIIMLNRCTSAKYILNKQRQLAPIVKI